MYFNKSIFKGLYNSDNFDKYDNCFYIIINRRKSEHNKSVVNENLTNDIIYKLANPLTIIYGHFYNEYNDILYKPVLSDGEIDENTLCRAYFEDLFYINGFVCTDKDYDKIIKYYDIFKTHPELYLKLNDNNLLANTI